jgi:hypothetical protein
LVTNSPGRHWLQAVLPFCAFLPPLQDVQELCSARFE